MIIHLSDRRVNTCGFADRPHKPLENLTMLWQYSPNQLRNYGICNEEEVVGGIQVIVT